MTFSPFSTSQICFYLTSLSHTIERAQRGNILGKPEALEPFARGWWDLCYFKAPVVISSYFIEDCGEQRETQGKTNGGGGFLAVACWLTCRSKD